MQLLNMNNGSLRLDAALHPI